MPQNLAPQLLVVSIGAANLEEIDLFLIKSLGSALHNLLDSQR